MGSSDPSRPEALLARARLFLDDAEGPTLALADVERLLADHPCAHEAAEALHLRAEALARAGALPAAVEAATKFLSAFPASWRAPEAAGLAADLLEARGRTGEAEALLRDVLARDPDRMARAHLDLGERGRYPARADPLLMRLGRLALASGDLASAEGAFQLVAAPNLSPDDYGETFVESPFAGEARAGLAEAALRIGGRREGGARRALARLAERHADSAAGRRALLAAGLPERVRGGRALALGEAGRLADAAQGSAPAGGTAGVLAKILEARAFMDPRGTLALAEMIAPGGLDARGREALSIARAHALEALGRGEEADAAFAVYSSARLALARAELARRRADGRGVRAALEAAAPSSDLAAALLEREGLRTDGARGVSP
jgi:tetratricopeptide (TPR) repeat protein